MMTAKNHSHFFECRVSGTFANTVNSNLYLTRSIQHTADGVGGSHTQVVMAMRRNDGFVYAVYMVYQIFYFCSIFAWQAISGSIWNINHGSSGFNNSLYHTGQIFIICTASVFCIKLYIVYITTCILNRCHRTLNDFFTSRIEFIFNVRVRSSDTCMYTFMLGESQRVGSHIYIFLHRTCQCTDSRPCNSLRNFNNRIKVARTRYRESCFYHIHTQTLQLLCNLNLLYCV